MKLAGNELKHSLLHALEQSLTGHTSICVAYSGGLDSTVLLHLCDLLAAQNEQLQLSAFHVHHGLSQCADHWLEHCSSVAKARNIPFSFSRVDLKKQAQQSVEAQAREARYKALSQHAGRQKLVLLAQHEDDQAETFLLQLKRGAGIKGLSSMPQSYTDNNDTRYLRPLLSFSREALAAFAQNEGLAWIEDDSNQDQRFDRNFLRLSILPLLSTRWAHFSKAVSRSALHCSNTQKVVDEYMMLIKDNVLASKQSAIITQLLLLSKETQAEFLRFWLKQFISVPPSSVQIQTLLNMIQSQSLEAAHLVVQDVCIERTQGLLLLSKVSSVSDELLSHKENGPISFAWQGQSQQKVSDSLQIVSIDEDEAVTTNKAFFLPYGNYKVEYGRMSLRAKMHEKRPSKSLKKWFQEWSVSPLRRQHIPILICLSDKQDAGDSEESVVALYCADSVLSYGQLGEKNANKQGAEEDSSLKPVEQKGQSLARVACKFKRSIDAIPDTNKLGSWALFQEI
jgi:tRNA(Ile)-lysidine synthase